MKILVLGSGGREHAFSWKIARSDKCEALFVAPGNAGTSDMATNVNLGVNDFEGIAAFVKEQAIDLVVVGPEDPLVKGISDFFSKDAELQNVGLVDQPQRERCLRAVKISQKSLCKSMVFLPPCIKPLPRIA